MSGYKRFPTLFNMPSTFTGIEYLYETQKCNAAVIRIGILKL